ncbi:MAG TPA: glycosyltransferase family A protein [Thermoanaerobaculia bacterium]|nr:glycosyltransferase family A protein [Thermoanaerobaculia bacterium]
MKPKVTVLIPVFNREQFVDEAIRSVIEQDYDDFELLLVDDGSTDGTPSVLETWKQRDPRVVVITSPANQGIPGALNLGLAHARGTYVARLDSDDFMMPRRLAGQVAVLDARPEVALVSCAYDVVDAEKKYLRTWKGDEPHEVAAFLLNFFNVVGGGGQVMFRLADVLEEGGFSLEYPSSEDYDLWVRLLRRGRIETLPFVGMIKRTHGGQAWLQYAGVKRANWIGIMRSSLEPYLRRALREDEVDALITVWRHDRRLGMAKLADEVMHEAFARFRETVSDRALRACARRKIARQWYVAARHLARHGHPLEALNYLARGARWLLTPRLTPLPDATA